MDTQSGSTSRSVAIADIVPNAKQYSFFQLVSLLETFSKGDREGAKFRFRANPSLAFPSSDIASIQSTLVGDDILTDVVVNFMGLYGPSSPLPAFYTERVLHAEDDDETARDFMDLFNHRMVEHFYQCWKKYRYYLQYKIDAKDNFSAWVFELAGLKELRSGRYKKLRWQILLPLSPLLNQHVKNAEGLCRLVEAYFGVERVEVVQCEPREVSVLPEQQCQMGMMSSSMGMDMVIGDTVIDRMSKFSIHLFDLSTDQYHRFLPTSDQDDEQNQHDELKELIQFYMTHQLHFDVLLHSKHKAHVINILSDQSAMKMGWNSCIGSMDTQAEYVTCL